MKEGNEYKVSGGGSVSFFLTLVVLKVMGYIELSWFWTLSSIVWFPAGLTILILPLIIHTVVRNR